MSISTMYIFKALLNPFTPTDRFSVIQNNEWKSPIKLLSDERVKGFVYLELYKYFSQLFINRPKLKTLDLFHVCFIN